MPSNSDKLLCGGRQALCLWKRQILLRRHSNHSAWPLQSRESSDYVQRNHFAMFLRGGELGTY